MFNINIKEWLITKKQEIDSKSKKSWVERYMEHHNLTKEEIASFVIAGMKQNKKVQKLRYKMFGSHLITMNFFLLFLFFAWALYPRLGDIAILLGFILSILLLFGRARMLENRIRAYIISEWQTNGLQNNMSK